MHPQQVSVSSIARPASVERNAIESVWAASQDADEPLGRPAGGWWSLTTWATAWRVLRGAGTIIGVAAIETQPSTVAEARLALLPSVRTPERAAALVTLLADLAIAGGASAIRLAIPGGAAWATTAAQAAGYTLVRSQHLMLRDPHTGISPTRPPAGVTIRPLAEGEDAALLAALNRAWADTWDFRPITPAALEADLAGRRAGMLVAIDDLDSATIIGTSHAQFDAAAANPDGGPFAWLSNLTIVPAWRGRGLGRALLLHGMRWLDQAGARSIALSVDDGAAAPMALYQSTGFRSVSVVGRWERSLDQCHRPGQQSAPGSQTCVQEPGAVVHEIDV